MARIEKVDGVVSIHGDLTFESVPGLVSSTPDFGDGDSLTIDLAGVDKADSAGLALLLGWVRKAQRVDRDLYFTGIPGQLRSLVRVADLGSLFRLAD